MGIDSGWIRASGADGSDEFVEMRRTGEMIEVRYSKNGETGDVLSFTPGEWDAWLDGAKKGEFDHLV
ncbi:DUF397 domain-containing protein [Kineosporia sp. NBRC 101731]|uniref:DUF397 domain-containing protein n=1 Tax=Kineosporia sp. NBRC 101731 TaxID=3032199 RepID=UPI0024A5B8E7|nr:DUF397 domain-containing protein [Kineosporia sp. NBRC 101731]GLY33318.1 hypothetical protein Kisp02_66830 [Kineosporia sp. NBRC 101731]